MLTGVVKLAPTMPFDRILPFLHLDRKFMHLGFYIYDVGFQSPNVEAAKPMVYAAALVLLVLVVVLNMAAITLRNRLRTLEQQVNGSDLPDDQKVRLQSYVTACYGTLTSFNVLFAEECDQFQGAGGGE
jgi:hypothetical protein